MLSERRLRRLWGKPRATHGACAASRGRPVPKRVPAA